MLATVGVPPAIGTAPPFTEIRSAALRLVRIVLLALSPNCVSTRGEKLAVVVMGLILNFLSRGELPACAG
jgi:hypothetical protein